MSLGAALGIVFALYGAAKGLKALIEGLNIIYDEQEERAPIVLNTIGLGPVVETLLGLLRWPILFVVALIVLAITPARWRWVSWGAAVATAIWTLGSIAFPLYVQNFGSYNDLRLARRRRHPADVVLVIGLYRTLGAELNSEVEHQTERNSTTGPPQPLGRRGADVADHVGEIP